MSGILGDYIRGHEERPEHGEVFCNSVGESGSELGWVWLAHVMRGLEFFFGCFYCLGETGVKVMSCN